MWTHKSKDFHHKYLGKAQWYIRLSSAAFPNVPFASNEVYLDICNGFKGNATGQSDLNDISLFLCDPLVMYLIIASSFGNRSSIHSGL